MVELYGTAFLTAYGEAPSPLWSAAIADLSDDECRNGLVALAKQGREYPANLTQFVAACRPQKGSPRFLGAPTTPKALAQLSAPSSQRAKPEVIDSWLASMRRHIGINQREPGEEG